MLITEWVQRTREHALDLTGIRSHIVKFAIYYILIGLLFRAYHGSESFIYFQF